ncbi:MAG: hypothetical protein KGL10_07115, partial [Alphaproteobacteria bacterium]|nr:hypothetical protein [Alphaproteobacteria bacterium]
MAIRYLKNISGLSLAVLLASTAPAFATVSTAGAMLTQMTQSISNMPNLFSAAAYLLGLLFALTGVFKFKAHVEDSRSTPLNAGVKRFLAAGMLFAAPFMSTALQGTLVGTGGTAISQSGVHSNAGLQGMDLMITQFIGNIAQPATNLLIAFAYIAAIALLVVGIVR